MQNSRREQQKSNWLSFGVSSAMIGGYFGRGGSRLYISSIPCSGWSLWGCPHLRQQPLLEQSLLQCKIHCEETGQENRTNTNMCMRQGGVMGHDTHNPQPPTLPSMPWEGVQAEARTTWQDSGRRFWNTQTACSCYAAGRRWEVRGLHTLGMSVGVCVSD